MAEGRRKEAWTHTSLLLATLINGNPYIDGDPVSPDDLNPYAPKSEPLRMSIGAWATMNAKPQPT